MDNETTPGNVPLSDQLGVGAEARCMCKDRAATSCPGEWEPGCDLGNNPAYVRAHQCTPEEREAIKAALGLRGNP